MAAKPKRQATSHKACDDNVIAIVAQEKLANFDTVDIKPDFLKQMLARLIELVEEAARRRPAHRPRSDYSGQTVAILMEAGMPQARARQKAAKLYRKTVKTIARAHNRYRQRERDESER
jgi:hypothetical protein